MSVFEVQLVMKGDFEMKKQTNRNSLINELSFFSWKFNLKSFKIYSETYWSKKMKNKNCWRKNVKDKNEIWSGRFDSYFTTSITTTTTTNVEKDAGLIQQNPTPVISTSLHFKKTLWQSSLFLEKHCNEFTIKL
jgi:hypothetical protein